MPQSVNLAPGTQYVLAARKQRRRILAIAIALVIFGLAIWGGLAAYQRVLNAQVAEVQDQLSTIETRIAQAGSVRDRIQKFEKRLGVVSSLLDQHVSWESFLQEIERLTLPSATLLSLNANVNDGLVRITGQAPNIDQVAQELATFTSTAERPTIFSNATLVGANRESVVGQEDEAVQTFYIFNASLRFDPQILRP